MKPRVKITDNFYTTDYTVVKHVDNGFCIIRLDEPFPDMPNFPERGMVGCTEFLTLLTKQDYRNSMLNQIL